MEGFNLFSLLINENRKMLKEKDLLISIYIVFSGMRIYSTFQVVVFSAN